MKERCTYGNDCYYHFLFPSGHCLGCDFYKPFVNQKDTFPTPEKQQEILREAIDFAKNQKEREKDKI